MGAFLPYSALCAVSEKGAGRLCATNAAAGLLPRVAGAREQDAGGWARVASGLEREQTILCSHRRGGGQGNRGVDHTLQLAEWLTEQ